MAHLADGRGHRRRSGTARAGALVALAGLVLLAAHAAQAAPQEADLLGREEARVPAFFLEEEGRSGSGRRGGGGRRALLTWPHEHVCGLYGSSGCYSGGGYCSAQWDCYGTWEAGGCGTSFFSFPGSCGCCYYYGNGGSATEQQQEEEELRQAVDPPPVEARPLPTLNLAEEEDEEDEEPAAVEEPPAVVEEPPAVIEEPPAPAVTNGTTFEATNGTLEAANGTLVIPPGSQTLILDLPTESASLDVERLIEALDSGLLSNENVTFVPGEEEGQYIAIVGPNVVGDSLILNVTGLLGMLGPDASVEIDCVGEGCEVSQEIDNSFRNDLAVALQESGQAGRRSLKGELYTRQKLDRGTSAEQLLEIKLGCGPQYLRTNISDGNETLNFNIVLQGPGIRDCVVEPASEGPDAIGNRFRNENATGREPRAQLQAEEGLTSAEDGEDLSGSGGPNLKVTLPVVFAVGGVAAAGLAWGVIAVRRSRKARESAAARRPAGSSGDGGAADGFDEAYIASKLSENESAVHVFGGRPEAALDSTPTKLTQNSAVLGAFGASNGNNSHWTPQTPPFTSPPLEESTMIQVSNPGRNELAVAEPVPPAEEGIELSGSSKKKRKGLKRWFPINLDAESKGKGKRKSPPPPQEKIWSPPAEGGTPNRKLIDAFASMPSAGEGSSSLLTSPEVQSSFHVIQKLIDEDDIED